MPNWTTTAYSFVGTEEQAAELYRKIEELEQMDKPFEDNSFGSLWLGCLVSYLGGNWKEVYCRGEICSYEMAGKNAVLLNCECAWDEMPEFRHFLERHYPGSKVYYQNEEPAMGIYTTNDVEGICFPDRYLLDSNEDFEYFETIEEAASYVGRLTCREVEPRMRAIRDALNEYADIRQENDEDVFYAFHEFRIIDG